MQYHTHLHPITSFYVYNTILSRMQLLHLLYAIGYWSNDNSTHYNQLSGYYIFSFNQSFSIPYALSIFAYGSSDPTEPTFLHVLPFHPPATFLDYNHPSMACFQNQACLCTYLRKSHHAYMTTICHLVTRPSKSIAACNTKGLTHYSCPYTQRYTYLEQV